MAKGSYQGTIAADIIEVRFAYSGKVARVNKRRGDRVKQGEVLASLDRTVWQKELEVQLAQYEKVRADFEIFAQKNPQPGDDITKYLKTAEQAGLNAAVKEVELAKMRVDMADLTSPVNGVVVEDGDNRTGLYVTPASNAYRVLDGDSLRLAVELEPEEAAGTPGAREVKVSAGGREVTGKTRLPYPMPSGKKYTLEVSLTDTSGLTPGMPGEVQLEEESKPG